jgi:pilus assembly protein CpaE
MAEETIKEVSEKYYREGRIIAVIGSKGGVGTTTIAVNLAVCLAEKEDVRSVALVDMNLLFGDVPLFMEIESTYNWRDITDCISRLNDSLLRDILSTDASGICVLPSPSYLSSQHVVTPDIIEHLLLLMRKVFDFIIIDGGQPLDDISFKILEVSDLALLISILSPPCILNTNRLLKTFQEMGFSPEENVKMVINRQLRAPGSSIKDYEGARIEKEIFWNVPNDYQTTIAAINQGKPLVQFAPNEIITKNLRNLADKFLVESEETDLPRSFFRQLVKRKTTTSRYVYQKKDLRIKKGRRKDDKAPYDPGPKEKAPDRRRKTTDGIILKDYDRRQIDSPDHDGPEKRSGIERRSGKNRRR